jgi:hypothetical protein
VVATVRQPHPPWSGGSLATWHQPAQRPREIAGLAMNCHAWSPSKMPGAAVVSPSFPTNLRVVGIVPTRVVVNAGRAVTLDTMHAVGRNRKEDIVVTGILRRPAISPDGNAVDVEAASVDVDTNPPVAAACAHGLHN